MSEQQADARIEQLEAEVSALKELLGNCIYIIDQHAASLQSNPLSGGMSFEPSRRTMQLLKAKAGEAGVTVRAIH